MPRKDLRGPRRRVLALLALVVGVAACTPTTSTTADTTTTLLPPPRSVLRVGVEEWPTCLNPLLCADRALQEQILQHVLPGAYRLDADNDYAPTAVLDGSAEIEVDDDAPDGEPAMTITYRLNPDARWADGMPITSSDFVGTWQAVMTTPGADTRGYDLIEQIDDRDPLQAVVTLSAPYGDWRELFGGARSHLLQADAFGATTDLTGSFETELPFSGGPYQLVSWSENEAVLARVDNVWDPQRAAQIDQVRYRPVVIDEVSPDSFDVLIPTVGTSMTAPDGYDAHSVPTTRVLGVWFDQRSPLLRVAAHRRALALALDGDALADTAADAGPVAGQVGCAGWVPAVGPWCEAAPSAYSHDLGRARSILADEGWVAGGGGTLVLGDQPFTVVMTTDPSDPVASAVADAVDESLAAIGISRQRASHPTAEWAATRSGDTTFGVGVYTLDLGVGPGTPEVYDCPSGRPTSVIGWCPAANADTTAALRTTVDVDARVSQVTTLGNRAQRAAAWVPLVQMADRIFTRSDRVAVPDSARAVGGPLADLVRFAVTA